MDSTPPLNDDPETANRPGAPGCPTVASPNAVPTTWFRLLAVLLFLGVVLLVGLMMPLPYRGRVASALGDLVHGPVFAAMAFGCYKLARRLGAQPAWAALIAWLLLSLFGAATEVAQSYVGRGESLQDAIDDALGAGGGVLIGLGLEAATPRRRLGIITVGCALVLAADVEPILTLWDCYEQRRAMPLLASFETQRELDRWAVDEAAIERTPSHATDGRWAMEVDLFPGEYPGVSLGEPPPDWSAYKELVFDINVEPAVTGAAATPLALIVKIQDEAHDGDYHDRFHQLLKLAPGRREVRIPLSEVAVAPRGRKMDMSRIERLQVFAINLPQPRTFYLDNIRLE